MWYAQTSLRIAKVQASWCTNLPANLLASLPLIIFLVIFLVQSVNISPSLLHRFSVASQSRLPCCTFVSLSFFFAPSAACCSVLRAARAPQNRWKNQRVRLRDWEEAGRLVPSGCRWVLVGSWFGSSTIGGAGLRCSESVLAFSQYCGAHENPMKSRRKPDENPTKRQRNPRKHESKGKKVRRNREKTAEKWDK